MEDDHGLLRNEQGGCAQHCHYFRYVGYGSMSVSCSTGLRECFYSVYPWLLSHKINLSLHGRDNNGPFKRW